MSKRKKILSLILPLSFAMAMLIGMTVTANAEHVQYPIWVGGTQVTSDNMSGQGWSYTPAITVGETTTPAKLTLNGYRYVGEGYDRAAIYAEEDLTLELVGDNTVESTADSGNGVRLDNLSTKHNLTVCGGGKLTSTNGTYGIHANGDVTINNVTLKVSGVGSYLGKVTINGGNVTASSSKMYAIYAGKDLVINGGYVAATAEWTGINANNVEIKKDVVSVIASGNKQLAIAGSVKNEIAGTGWTDVAGKEGRAAIGTSATGQKLNYKKVQFPTAPEPTPTPTPTPSVTETAPQVVEIVDLPKVKTSKPSVTAAKKKLTAKWPKPTAKNLKKIDGIEIRVTGPGYDRIFTVGKKKTSKKIGGLQSKQKYAVRVRTYRYAGGVKHVSAWSGAKSVKVK